MAVGRDRGGARVPGRRARLKVALVTSIPYGGPVEHAILLARDLTALGVSVRAVAVDDAVAARFADAGARAAVLPLRSPGDWAGAVRVHRFVRGADVVHSHDRRSGLWMRLGPSHGALRVHTLHGLPEPYLDETRPGLKARLAYGGLERALRTDVLIAPSHAAARLLSERVGYALEDIVVVPNGVDFPPQPFTPGDARRDALGPRAGQGTVRVPRGGAARAGRAGRARASSSTGRARSRRSCASARAGCRSTSQATCPLSRPCARSPCSPFPHSWRRAGWRCWRRWPRASRPSRAGSGASRRRRRPARRRWSSRVTPAALAHVDPRPARRSVGADRRGPARGRRTHRGADRRADARGLPQRKLTRRPRGALAVTRLGVPPAAEIPA